MTKPHKLRRWSSPGQPSRSAAEIPACEFQASQLADALAEAATALDGEAFLVIAADSVEPLGTAEIAAAIAAFRNAGAHARLCLAGDYAALQRLDTAGIDYDEVGLMLDGVDMDTPTSMIIWDRIEAVRFHPDFVAQAARNLRLGCALESMLGLAKDLGLCTLGSNAMPGGASLKGQAEFDYMPSPASAAAPVRLAAHAGRAKAAAASFGSVALSR